MPPINGQTLDKYGFIGLSVFSGVAELLGMIFIVVARWKYKSGLFVKA